MNLKDLQQKYWNIFIKVALIKRKLASGEYRLIKQLVLILLSVKIIIYIFL